MPVHNTAGGSSIFFAKVPDFSLLCSVVCRLENNSPSAYNFGPGSSSGIHNPSRPSISSSQDTKKCGQSNVLKCRELIFTESNVLASPSLQEEGNIYVIITSEFWQSGKLQERCQKMSLQVGKPIRVIPAVFQACFTYTLKAKLAPLWNKVGEYYIQGRDFITSTGILGAINLETNVTDGEICLAVKPLTVKMPHCTLQDFGVLPPIINHFLVDINYIISEYSVDDKWCYVLPSMKKGKVVSLTHHIPSSSPYKTYGDLKKYWKNNYGYRLPESGEGIVYINIFFPAIPHTMFTYPEFCIRKIELRPVPRVDSTPVLQAFLTDIKKKMPHMCLTPLEVTRKPQYTAVTMNSANKIESKGHSSMTLINRKSTVPQRIPARALVPVSESRSQQHGTQPQVSPYRPLTGHPAYIKSATGYIIKTPQNVSPVTPALPPSQFGYPHDGSLSKNGQQNPQQGSSLHCPLPYGSNTKVTPSRRHHDLQSPRQSPYAAKSNLSMPMSSPGQKGLFCTPPHPYVSPANTGAHPYPSPANTGAHPYPSPANTGAHPYASPANTGAHPYASPANTGAHPYASPANTGALPYPSPANTRAYAVGQHLTPITGTVATGRKEFPQSAPKSARNLNHTIFSLAADQLQHYSEQDINSNSPHHSCMPAYRKEGGRYVGSAGDASCLPPPPLQQMQNLPESNGMLQPGNGGGFQRKEVCRETQQPSPPQPKPFVPIFNPKPSRSIPAAASGNQTPQVPKIKPSFTPHKPRSVMPSTFMSRATTTPTHKPATHPSTIDLIACEDIIPPTQPALKQNPHHHLPNSAMLLQQQCSPSPSSSATHHQPAARQALHFGPSKVSSFKTVSKPSHPPLVHVASSTNNHDKKRKAKDCDDAGEAKKSKPRSKPKVQENVDVQLMAQNDQLSKVNSITLVAWLKEKGVHVSSKDKKLDLISKVMTFINCTAKEM